MSAPAYGRLRPGLPRHADSSVSEREPDGLAAPPGRGDAPVGRQPFDQEKTSTAGLTRVGVAGGQTAWRTLVRDLDAQTAGELLDRDLDDPLAVANGVRHQLTGQQQGNLDHVSLHAFTSSG